jgi:drug/metabolite transporter (DMT)-like permease
LSAALHTRRGAYALLVLLTLIWGTNWMVMKIALGQADPVVYTIQRTGVAAVVLFGVLVWQRRPLLPQSWMAVTVVGLLQTTINSGALSLALVEGGAGRTSILQSTMPFWTLVIAWPILHERVRGAQWFAIGLALFGLTVVIEPWNWRDGPVAKILAVVSGLGWAGGTVAIKYLQREMRLDLLNFCAWQFVIGIVPLVAFALLVPRPDTQWDATFTLLLLYTSVFSNAIGFILWNVVLRHLPAGRASLNLLAVPVIALLTSIAFLGERLSVTEWLGIACIAAALALNAFQHSRATGTAMRDTLTPPIEGP